jgi:hypothetical protein
MNAIAGWWLGLEPATQTALASVIVGIVLWLLQRVWAACPWLPLLTDASSPGRKKAVAVVLALVAACAQAQGDWQRGLVAFIAALGASQAAFALAPRAEPEP